MEWARFFTHPILKQYPIDIVQDAIDTVVKEEGKCNYEEYNVCLVCEIVSMARHDIRISSDVSVSKEPP